MALVIAAADTVLLITCPTIPAPAESAAVVPVIAGVVREGDVANTAAPEPVSSVKVAAKLALEGVAKNVATPVPSPLTPVLIGSPVQLVNVPDVGVPSIGVTNVGDVANTLAPLPVSSVNAAAKLALEGVARKVATLAPKPLTPVLIGRPVQLVKVPEEGVPRAGVTNVGDVANTAAPEPVSSVNAAAKLALEGVVRKVATPVPNPDMPELTGSPVQFVRTPDVGVPNNGVTNVGDVANTAEPVPVSSVNVAAKLALEGVDKNVATPVANPDTPVLTGKPVQLVRTPDVGVPNNAVTNVGVVSVGVDNAAEFCSTMSPVPVVASVNFPVVPATRSPTNVSPDATVPKFGNACTVVVVAMITF